MKIVEGEIVDVEQGQNLLGSYSYRLTIKIANDKFIRLLDYPYNISGVWNQEDVGKKGLFTYGWDLIMGRTLKRVRLCNK